MAMLISALYCLKTMQMSTEKEKIFQRYHYRNHAKVTLTYELLLVSHIEHTEWPYRRMHCITWTKDKCQLKKRKFSVPLSQAHNSYDDIGTVLFENIAIFKEIYKNGTIQYLMQLMMVTLNDALITSKQK